jgi:predicted ester cyclase
VGVGPSIDVDSPIERRGLVSKEENLAAQSIGGEIEISHDYNRFDEVMAQSLIDHDGARGQAPGVEGIKQYWRSLGKSFPDWKIDVDVVLADEEYVALTYRLSGTHQGEFLGYAPTGRRFEVRSLQVGKFENGLMAERWGATDILGILVQLGLVRDHDVPATP